MYLSASPHSLIPRGFEQKERERMETGAFFASRPDARQLERQLNMLIRHLRSVGGAEWCFDHYASLFRDIFAGTPGATMEQQGGGQSGYSSLLAAVVMFDNSCGGGSGTFARRVLPQMCEAACNFDTIVPRDMPVLVSSFRRRGEDSQLPQRAVLTQRQCFAILSAAFFCAFPSFSPMNRDSVLEMPWINYNRLFHQNPHWTEAQKLAMHLDYFFIMSLRLTSAESQKMVDAPEEGLVLVRLTAPHNGVVIDPQIPLRNFVMHPLRESIDDQLHMTRIDFANMYIGGGSLSAGCVQEEITFSCCPELNVSRYLCEKMNDSEALFLMNAETFSSIVPGTYGRTMLRAAAVQNNYSDKCSRPKNIISAIDAVHFIPSGRFAADRRVAVMDQQFTPEAIRRELIKAIAGFQKLDKGLAAYVQQSPDAESMLQNIATGNWGCGAFNGHPELKILIQWIAASCCGKTMHYFPFDNERLHDFFPRLAQVLVDRHVTVGALLNLLYLKAFDAQSCSLFELVGETFGVDLSSLSSGSQASRPVEKSSS